MYKNILIWLVLGFLLTSLFGQFDLGTTKNNVTYSEFIQSVKQGDVSKVTIAGNNITGIGAGGIEFSTYSPGDLGLMGDLLDNGVIVEAKPPEKEGFFKQLIISLAPILLLIGVILYTMKGASGQMGGKNPLSFGKSKARLITKDESNITFKDVAGVDEAKEEVGELVQFLSDPGKFTKVGGKIPKGVLMVGPPGTGKTLLAKAVAGEANVPFFFISGSDFVEMFVGVGASRVRDMFEQAKKNAPCIIFIDEIDAVGRQRGAGMGGGHDEREQTLNQMLVEMDGFEANEGVILIAATNRPDVLDPALLRPGRFDRQVVVPNPDVIGREKILKVHMRKTPLSEGVEPRVIARGTPGFSGADLANLVNEAALLAARKGRRTVSMAEFEEAKDKVMLGAERRSMVMTDEEKRLTAYHEAGHAVVALHCSASDPIHKATIIPRGRALGMVMRLPEGDRISLARDKIHADLRVACGGRIAEDLIFGYDKVTTGASSDIRMVTDMARRMVTEWGMSDKLGFLAYSADEQEVFLGRSVSQQKNVADATASIIDTEVRRIVDEAYKDATKILKKNDVELERLAQGLLEYETLDGNEIKIIVEGGTLVRKDAEDTPINQKPKRKSRTGLPGTGRPKKPGSEPA